MTGSLYQYYEVHFPLSEWCDIYGCSGVGPTRLWIYHNNSRFGKKKKSCIDADKIQQTIRQIRTMQIKQFNLLLTEVQRFLIRQVL